MNNLELQKEITPPQENLGNDQDNRLSFLDNPEFIDIKEQLTKTITDLSNEHIITPEEDFRNNIEQVTKDIFSDPLYDFDPDQKTADAQKIFLFRTKFEKIKKENIKNTEENTNIQNKDEKTIETEKSKLLRKNLKEKYDKIDEKYKIDPTSDEINKKKEQINEETRKKLDASKISTDEYAKFLVFEQKYEKKLRKNGDEEFLKNSSFYGHACPVQSYGVIPDFDRESILLSTQYSKFSI